MFDTILCSAVLPLPEDAKNLSSDWSKEDFQTKDLDNSMSLYIITEQGELHEEIVEREYIQYTKEEEEDLRKRKGYLYPPFKDVVIKNRYTRALDYHGRIQFYHSIAFSDTQDYWLEFAAYFTYGKLDKIELVEARKDKSYKVYNLEFAAKRAELEAKLSYRVKRFLWRLGWRKFWSIVADKLNKLQTFIYTKVI